MTGKQMGRWAWFGRSAAIGCAAAFALVTLANATEPPKWELSVAANDSDEAQIVAGWPVLLRVSVVWTGEGPGFDTFDPTQAAWTVTSGKGEPRTAQIVQLSGPQGKTRIDASNDTLTLLFGISPDQTAKADGDYVLTLSAAGQQARVRVTVNPAPAQPDAKFQSDRRFAFAEYSLAAGDAAGALGLMQEELTAQPESVAAMSLSASALVALQRKPEAFAMLGAALKAVKKQQAALGGPPEPTPDLSRRYYDLLAELAHLRAPSAPKASAKPPVKGAVPAKAPTRPAVKK